MQIVSLGDNLHEMSNPIFRRKYGNIISLSSAEFAHSMVCVKHDLTVRLFWSLLSKIGLKIKAPYLS